MNQTFLNIMGVMNVTPNSFSDGGHLNGLDVFIEKLKEFDAFGVSYFDIGAESTAPMNDPITLEEEWERLSLVLEAFSLYRPSGKISLDTYRPETAFRFFKELETRGFSDSAFVWNDVSGVWDEDVEKFLEVFPSSRYVFCHNEAPERSLASHHMDYVFNKGKVSGVLEAMAEFLSTPLKTPFKERVILDPCFGFSKSYEQNWALIDGFPDLVSLLGRDIEFVFGVSRKSFLRSWWLKNMREAKGLNTPLEREILLSKSEILHVQVIEILSKKLAENGLGNPIFRVHDPEIVHFALS